MARETDFLGLGYWLPSWRADPRACALYRRHYSAVKNARPGRPLGEFMPPGETMVLLGADCQAVWGWSRSTVPRYDRQEGVACTVFRNESAERSSDLVREASALAWQRWPGQRLFTYVDPTMIASANPGYCFKQAGWAHVRDAAGRPTRSRRGLLLLECVPHDAA